MQEALFTESVAVAGEVRRRLEVVENVVLVAATTQPEKAHKLLNSLDGLTADPMRSGPFAWRGTATTSGVKVEVLLVAKEDFTNQLFLLTGAEAHLSEIFAPQAAHGQPATLRQLLKKERFYQETAIYEKAGLQYVEPELREGLGELTLAKEHKLPILLEDADLRGSVHNHSNYSDGAHTLRQMAEFLRDEGYEYLGICDHSQAAHYANGLSPERVRQQHREIDELEQRTGPLSHF